MHVADKTGTKTKFVDGVELLANKIVSFLGMRIGKAKIIIFSLAYILVITILAMGARELNKNYKEGLAKRWVSRKNFVAESWICTSCGLENNEDECECKTLEERD